MKEKIFKLKWDEKLGAEWMNIDNLKSCLFGSAQTNEMLLQVTELPSPEVCECKELRMAYLGQCRVCRLPICSSKAIEPLDTHGLKHFNTAITNKLNEIVERCKLCKEGR